MTSTAAHCPSCGCEVCSRIAVEREIRVEARVKELVEADSSAHASSPREIAETFALLFRCTANSYALAYGGPLYLVGSMLTSPNPGDIDIRVMLERADIEQLFGENVEGIPQWTPATYAKCREELKQSRRLTRRWCRTGKSWGTRVDFQFQISLAGANGLPIMREDRPSLRLDDVPLSYLEAGRGEP